jgi:hypothetical protein
MTGRFHASLPKAHITPLLAIDAVLAERGITDFDKLSATNPMEHENSSCPSRVDTILTRAVTRQAAPWPS